MKPQGYITEKHGLVTAMVLKSGVTQLQARTLVCCHLGPEVVGGP